MTEWNDAEEHAERAHEFYELGRWEEAEAELRKAISLNPDQAEWHYNLGLTLEAAGRINEAIQEFEICTDLEPDNPQPLVNLGINLNRLEKYTVAIERLERAAKLAPDFEPAYCPQITAFTSLGRHEEAEEIFYMARLIKDECPSCFANLGESLLNRREIERAIWCFKEAARLDPRMPRIHARLAATYAIKGQFEQAYRLYLRDLREDPGNVDTLLDLGELFLSLNRLLEASEKFRRVLELEPTNVDAHFRLGQLAVRSHRFDVARVEFELVNKLSPGYPGVPRQIALIHLENDEIEPARRRLATVMQSFEEDEDDLAGLAELLVRAGMNRPACRVLELLVEQEPESAEAWHHLGTASFLAREYVNGITATRQALHLEPKHPRAIHNLILAYMESRRYMRALAAVRLAERRLGKDATVRRLAVRLRITIIRRAVWGFMFRSVKHTARKLRNQIIGSPKRRKRKHGPNSPYRRPTNV